MFPQAPRAVAQEAPLRRLMLDPAETRSYGEEAVRFEEWLDPQTVRVTDSAGRSRTVRLFALDIPAGKSAEAFRAIAGLGLTRGDAVFIFKAKHYDEPGVPFELTPDGHLKAYLYFADAREPGLYRNLNAILAEEGRGLTRLSEGRPDAVMKAEARLSRDGLDYARAAWEAAYAPYRELGIDSPELERAYQHRIAQLSPGEARAFASATALLAQYSRMELLPSALRGELLAELLGAGSSRAWSLERLAPAVRAALAEQRVPPPAGRGSWAEASWQEVLLWGSAGKLGAAPDRLYFPSERQVALMREFLAAQGVDQDDPLAFGEGVVYARLYLRIPGELRGLVPKTWIRWSAGAFWAPAEASQLHRHLLYEHALVRPDKRSPLSPVLMAMAYSYPETAAHLFSDAREVVALSHGLALEAMREPKLARIVHEALAGIVSEPRRAEVLKLLSEGQVAAAGRALTPAETFMLGRSLVDHPQLHRHLLSSHLGIRAKAGRLSMMGMNRDEFYREIDALLALPGGASAAQAPLPGFEESRADQWRLERRLFAELLIQTLVSMDKDGVPARFLPMLLPHGAEAVLRGTQRTAGDDYEAFAKAVRKITPAQVHGWMFAALRDGAVAGTPLDSGLLDRGDLTRLLTQDLGSAAKVERYDSKNVIGSLGFPGYFAADLKTFKSGSFRVDPDKKAGYEHWKKGELIKVMVGKGQSRQGLFNTRIVAIERKALGDLTLDELRSEFPATRFLRPWVSDEELRKELIDELHASLKRFYPHVTLETKGVMIRFESYPEVQHKN